MTMPFIAALPMYDWPEQRDAVDAQWVRVREDLRRRGIDAPEHLTRRNADMPPVPGGIRDERGAVIGPDPATLPPDELDIATLWRHPALLFAQACWGPLDLGLLSHVAVIAQPHLGDVEGAPGPFYSSAIVMRRADVPASAARGAPADGEAAIPLDRLKGRRFAFNDVESLSGYLALQRDLQRQGSDLSVFASLVETGGHRASIRTLAQGGADVAAIDARSWHAALAYEPAAGDLVAVGWTARRKAPPMIAAKALAHLHRPD